MEQIILIGMDTSTHVFQLHGMNAADDSVLRKKLRRKEILAFFEKLPSTVVAIEACGGPSTPRHAAAPGRRRREASDPRKGQRKSTGAT